MVHSHSVLAFFDSGTSHYLILDSFSALHSILVCIDASQRINTESGVVIIYIIRLYHYMRSVDMKQCSRFRTSARQSYGIFYFYYSSNDHDFFYQVHGTRVFSELIGNQVIIQKTTFRTCFGYYEFLIVFSEPPTLGSLYRFSGPRAPLASPNEGHILIMREPN